MESPGPLQLVLDESDDSPDFLEAEPEAGDEASSGSEEPTTYTDDPVRAYLREVGSVSLLTRQGEVDLARRMERGRCRVRKVLSRSSLVQQKAMDLYQDVSQGRLRLDDVAETGGPDAAAKQRNREKAMRRFTKAWKLHRHLVVMEKDVASTPHRHVHVRAKLKNNLLRLKVKLSQALREVPFSSSQWTEFRSAFKSAADELIALESDLRKCDSKQTGTKSRELKRMILQREAAVGCKVSDMRRCLQAMQKGEREAEQAKQRLVEANLATPG